MDKFNSQCAGIIAKPIEQARKVIETASETVIKNGGRFVYDKATASFIGQKNGLERTEMASECGFLIVIGGDGTLLSVARSLGGKTCPILGVNLGRLGFITEVTVEELPELIHGIYEGRCGLQKRAMLISKTVRNETEINISHVLNDVVINKGALARMIELELFVDDMYVSDFRADGLIISTPTGSTAYSLAAGGPLLYPTMDAIIVNPICPHTLTLRPLVIPGNVNLTVHLLGRHSEEVYLTLDGQTGIPILCGDKIEICQSPDSVYLIQSPKRNFFGVLKEKLKWSEK